MSEERSETAETAHKAAPGSEASSPPPAPGPAGEQQPGGAPSFRGALGDPQALIDGAGPAVAFVVASRLVDVPTAGMVALALAGLLVVVRRLRGQPLQYALGGFLAVAVAVGAAVWTGQAEAYFVPSAALNALYAVGAVVSILARRPLVAWAAAFAQRRPLPWFWQPHVRPAYAEITWAWAALFATRAVVRYALIVSGELEALAVAHVALGLPAFAALLVATYAYLRWRLPRLAPVEAPDDAPDRD